jgi:hypothetical protein
VKATISAIWSESSAPGLEPCFAARGESRRGVRIPASALMEEAPILERSTSRERKQDAYNRLMKSSPWTLRGLRQALDEQRIRPTQLAEQALAQSNQNANSNTYLWQNSDWTRAEAERVEAMPRDQDGPFRDGHGPLWGLPVSVKDCFDLAGAPTSCGVHFYRDLNGDAAQDSWLVARLRAMGAVMARIRTSAIVCSRGMPRRSRAAHPRARQRVCRRVRP